MLGLGDFQPKARESREVRTESTVSRSGDLNTFAISLSYDAHWRLRKKNTISCRTRWYIPVIQAFRILKQEHCKLEDSLGYIVCSSPA